MLQIPYEYLTEPTYFKFLEELCQDRNDVAFCVINLKDASLGWRIAEYCAEQLANLVIKPSKVIIDDFTEANDADLLERMISNIEKLGIARENILYIHGGEDSATPGWITYPTFYREFNLLRLSQYLTNRIPWNQRSKIFVSLARRPNWFRVAITEELIKRNCIAHGLVSCGSDPDSFELQFWKDLWVTNPEYKSQFPFLLDGTVGGGEELFKESAYLTDAFVNLVSETSNDRHPDYEAKFADWTGPRPNSAHHWHRMFITEKTLKPYAMHQLPVFNTVKGHVKNLRDMGIDVFDDIVDHSYDNVDHPIERVQAVGAEIERLCNLGVDYFKQLNLDARFETARNRFMEQEKIKLAKFEQVLTDFVRK